MSEPTKRWSPQKPDLKSRVISCINKLSDRDTVSIATTELESIARTLPEASFSSFIACIHSTDSSAKSPVRKQCVSLLTLLSRSHGDSLSPHLPRMVSAVVNRLRDPDTAVRSACVEAAAAMAAEITKPPFSAAIVTPLAEAIATARDANSQIGAALCLAAAVEAAPEIEVKELRKVLLPRLSKLARSEGFKAKAALLVLVGSIVGVGGASSRSVLDWWIPCIVEFLGSEDWAVRKAAAEVLAKVALAERDLATEYKASCLASLESRRFDKVKIVRETMNRTLELWKGVPGSSEEVSVASRSSTDNVSGSSSPPSSKSSRDISPRIPQTKKIVPTNRSPPSDCSLGSLARRGTPFRSNDRNMNTNTNTVNVIKVDHKKPSNCKVEITCPQPPNSIDACGDDDNVAASLGGKENSGNSRPETKRSLFTKISDDGKHRFGGLRSGSRVVPFDGDENPDLDSVVHTAAGEIHENAEEEEDLSLIHKQLLQIENQQSNLLELLQRFMGTSQSGINSLETRVHDIEVALDEMSHNLAVSRGRTPNTDFADNACCNLPGSDFLSSKFWRRTEDRYTKSRVSPGSNQLPNSIHNSYDGAYNRIPKNMSEDGERLQFHNARGFVGA